MSFKLTRLLYSYDEVKLSLLCSLLKKNDIVECYYWCSELYYSDPDDNFDIFKFIWKIYFDFYAVHNGFRKVYSKKRIELGGKARYQNIAITYCKPLALSRIT